MAQLLLQDHEIVEALDLETNEEAMNTIKQLFNDENLTVYGFAEALKRKFNEVDVRNSTRLQKRCKDFLVAYKSKEYAAQKRAEREVCSTGRKQDYVDCYQIIDKSFECNICQNNFEKKKEINKHIRNEHKKEEIEQAVSRDDELLRFKASTFIWPGIKSESRVKADLVAATRTEEEYKNQIEMDKEIKIYQRAKIKTLKKNLEITICERDALKKAAEEESMDDDATGFAVTPEKDFIIMERSSSITEGAYHGTKVRF